MIIGFTGTREGMSILQCALLDGALARLCPREAHHGDCANGDEAFHHAVRRMWPRCHIVIHPPTDDRLRAYCEGDEIRDPKPYLVRNLQLVACIDELVAAPRTDIEELKSGTWATIRYARRAGKPVHMLRRR